MNPTTGQTAHLGFGGTMARRALVRVASAAVLANATWFSATAVVPALERDWSLTAAGAAWLVVVVQVGFVAGSIAAAVLNLPDRLPPRLLMASAALVAGVANLGLLLADGLTVALPTVARLLDTRCGR